MNELTAWRVPDLPSPPKSNAVLKSKRHCNRDNCTGVTARILNWLAEGVNRGPSMIFSYLYLSYLDLDDGLRLCQKSDT